MDKSGVRSYNSSVFVSAPSFCVSSVRVFNRDGFSSAFFDDVSHVSRRFERVGSYYKRRETSLGFLSCLQRLCMDNIASPAGITGSSGSFDYLLAGG